MAIPSPTPDSIASILSQLTTPDTNQVRHAEQALNQLLSHPTSIPPLSEILCANPSPPLRHLSSILLRRVISRHWGALDNSTRSAIKSAFLPRLSTETDAAPRRGLIFLTAAICRVEDILWPELSTTAMQLARSENPIHRAAAFKIFQSLADAVPLKIVPHLPALIPVFVVGLDDPQLSVRIAALHAYEAAVSPAAVHEGPAFDALAELVPKVVAVATSHMDTQSDDFGRVACAVFDILTLIMEIPSGPRVKTYFQDAVHFALRVMVLPQATYVARSAATEFVVSTAQSKPKTMRKFGLAVLAVQSACGVVFDNAEFAGDADAFGHEEDDAEETEVGAINLALRLLDALARRPEVSKQVFVEVMTIVSSSLEGVENLEARVRDGRLAASYRVIGSVCRGCSVDLTAHAEEVVKKLADGAMDLKVTFGARARAMEALGMACEALDTDEMPDEVTANLANAALSAVLLGMRDPQLLVRKHACLALEPVVTMFREDTNVFKKRVADVIQALGGLGADAAVEAVVAVGVLAEHATEAFASSEMYKDVIKGIVRLMSQTDEKEMLSRIAALEAAGALVSACKDQSVIETLANHAIGCLDVDDPTCKHATYSFFAKMADAVGGSVVAVFGVKVLTCAAQSMEREDVVFVPENNDDGQGIGNGIGGDDDEEDQGPGSFQVRTAYLDEKVVATACVGAFGSAVSTDAYIERVSASVEAANAVRDLLARAVGLVDDLTSYFHEDVRAAAHRAYSRMAGANVALLARHPALAFAGTDFVREAFAKIVYGMQEDDDIWVVTNVLASTSTFLGLVPPDIVAEQKTAVLDGIHTLISGEATCQITADDDSDEQYGDGEDAGGDEIDSLIEAVGDVIEAMAHSLRGYFAQDFPMLLKRMLDCLYSKAGSPRNKGMVLGAVAGVLLFMNWDRCTEFTPPALGSAEYELALATSDDTAAVLLPLALTAIQSSESKTLQRNAVFLTGVIFSKARATKSEVWQFLPQALSLFQEILSAQKSLDGALVDNAAGAVARIAVSKGAPKGTFPDHKVVLQAVLSPVPLKDDPTENTTVARALTYIAQSHFGDLITEEILQSALSCLVSAGLLYHESQAQIERGIRHDVHEADPNDKMTHLDKEEFWALTSLLFRLREKVGDEPFHKLGLSAEDGGILAQMLQANRS